MTPRLPNEIIARIVKLCRRPRPEPGMRAKWEEMHQQDLASLMRVNSTFNLLVAPIFYQAVIVDSFDKFAYGLDPSSPPDTQLRSRHSWTKLQLLELTKCVFMEPPQEYRAILEQVAEHESRRTALIESEGTSEDMDTVFFGCAASSDALYDPSEDVSVRTKHLESQLHRIISTANSTLKLFIETIIAHRALSNLDRIAINCFSSDLIAIERAIEVSPQYNIVIDQVELSNFLISTSPREMCQRGLFYVMGGHKWSTEVLHKLDANQGGANIKYNWHRHDYDNVILGARNTIWHDRAGSLNPDDLETDGCLHNAFESWSGFMDWLDTRKRRQGIDLPPTSDQDDAGNDRVRTRDQLLEIEFVLPPVYPSIRAERAIFSCPEMDEYCKTALTIPRQAEDHPSNSLTTSLHSLGLAHLSLKGIGEHASETGDETLLSLYPLVPNLLEQVVTHLRSDLVRMAREARDDRDIESDELLTGLIRPGDRLVMSDAIAGGLCPACGSGVRCCADPELEGPCDVGLRLVMEDGADYNVLKW